MEKQEIINPYELSKDEKLKKQKTFYSKSKAIKYLQAKATHFEVTKKLFNMKLNNDRSRRKFKITEEGVLCNF